MLYRGRGHGELWNKARGQDRNVSCGSSPAAAQAGRRSRARPFRSGPMPQPPPERPGDADLSGDMPLPVALRAPEDSRQRRAPPPRAPGEGAWRGLPARHAQARAARGLRGPVHNMCRGPTREAWRPMRERRPCTAPPRGRSARADRCSSRPQTSAAAWSSARRPTRCRRPHTLSRSPRRRPR